MLNSKENVDTKRLPMMPIRGVVFFPWMTAPFVVGRESSVRALEAAMAGDKRILLITQHDASVDEPKVNQIYSVGTIVNIAQSIKSPDGNIKVLIEGVERARVVTVTDDEGFYRATAQTPSVKAERNAQQDALISQVQDLFQQYIRLGRNRSHETMTAAILVDDPDKQADLVAANLPLTVEEKQALLEIFEPEDRLRRVAEKLTILNNEIQRSREIRMMKGSVNEAVRLPFEVRAFFLDGTSEVMSTAMALGRAQAMGLDLILIESDAIPSIARVMDYKQWLNEDRQKRRGGV